LAYCENCGGELLTGERCAKCAKDPKAKIKIGKAALIVICSLLVILAIGGIVGVKAVRSHQALESLNLGNTYMLEGNYEQAILAYDKAIKLESRNIDARLGKANALITLDRVAEAEEVLNEALKIGTKAPAIYLGLYDIYLERGDIPGILTLLDSGYNNTKDSGIQKLLQSYQERVSIVASSASLYVNQPIKFRLVYEEDNLTVDLEATWSTDSAGSSISENSDGSANITASEPGDVTVNAVYGSLSKESTLACRIAISASYNASNDVNWGLAAYADGWIYYCVPEGGSIPEDGIYRIRSDGSNNHYVGPMGYNIYIVDSWIYSANNGIQRMRLDGTEQTVLSDQPCDYFTVRDGQIYYIDSRDGRKLYRMRVDGSGQELLTDDCCYNFVVEDWIYYAGRNSDDSGIFRIRRDGTDREKLWDGLATHLQIADNKFYFISDTENICQVSFDWINPQMIVTADEIIWTFNITDGRIYYSTWYEIFRVCLDGSNRQELNNQLGARAIVIVEDWILFYPCGQSDLQLFRMRSDGSDLRNVN